VDGLDGPLDQQPLAAPARLRPVPERLVPTRLTLHRLAEETISPVRREATGKIGLRATPGGFGTPPFGDGLRLQGTELITETTGDGTVREIVEVDADAAEFVAEWFAFGASVLLQLRATAGASADPSLIQLWPEHFDIAVELGAEAAGARATYGFSPGDEQHPEPYVYVSAWQTPPPSPLWNATAFSGAELAYAELLAARDPRAVASEFCQARFDALTHL
jgi:hypothetical protein